MEKYLVGIDDTDNKNSRGTGFLSRQIASMIHKNKLGLVSSISRHQLFVHKSIPYTSQNSSACLCVEAKNIELLQKKVEEYLLENAALGSDVGLAISSIENVNEHVINWGQNAKVKVLRQLEATKLASDNGVFLKGLTGTNDGIIGALAALGLRKSGNDGRCIWLEGKELREIEGVYKIRDLFGMININSAMDIEGNILNESEKIFTGNWLRPVIRNNKITIIAEQSENTLNYDWKVADKEFIKSISD